MHRFFVLRAMSHCHQTSKETSTHSWIRRSHIVGSVLHILIYTTNAVSIGIPAGLQGFQAVNSKIYVQRLGTIIAPKKTKLEE